jgi:hypothetical protein
MPWVTINGAHILIGEEEGGVRDFSSDDHGTVNDEMRKDYSEWKKSLTPEENDALKIYTGGGYTDLNRNLREGKSVGEVQQHSDSANPLLDALGFNDLPSDRGNVAMSAGEATRHIDSALNKAVLKKDTKLYRGFESEELFNAFKGGKKVSSFEDKGFLSTSARKSIAERFVMSKTKAPIIIEITARKGSRAAYVTWSDISTSQTENEMVLPRRSRLRVTGHRFREHGHGEVLIITGEYK